MTNVTPGRETTEYEVAKGAGFWGVVAMVLGLLVTVGSTAIEATGSGSAIGIIAGAVVTAAGAALKALVSLGYIKARKEIKIVATEEPERSVGFNGGDK